MQAGLKVRCRKLSSSIISPVRGGKDEAARFGGVRELPTKDLQGVA